MIWFAMLIPAFTAVALYGVWKHRMAWFEYLVPAGVSFATILACKTAGESVAASDTEFWGGAITTAEYYEPWNERVSCSHPKYDRKGNFQGYKHFYDVEYHGAYWQATDTNGITTPISKSDFEKLCAKFGNRRFVELNRGYHTLDGDKYASWWDGSDASLEPCCTRHSYENRVMASDSVFNLRETQHDYALFDYPPISGWSQPVILGLDAPEAERKLQILNARLGPGKQVRVWVLVFQGQPFDAAIQQMNRWKNGNKNELVACVGVDEMSVRWAYCFCWGNESLKVEVRDFLNSQGTLDLVAFAEWLRPKVESEWQRKRFREFNYLDVEPSGWAVLLTFLLTAAVSGATSWWSISNDIH